METNFSDRRQDYYKDDDLVMIIRNTLLAYNNFENNTAYLMKINCICAKETHILTYKFRALLILDHRFSFCQRPLPVRIVLCNYRINCTIKIPQNWYIPDF